MNIILPVRKPEPIVRPQSCAEPSTRPSSVWWNAPKPAGSLGMHRLPRHLDHVRDLVADRVAKSACWIATKWPLPITQATGYKGLACNFRRLVS